MNGKGDTPRLTDIKRFRKNYDAIDWGSFRPETKRLAAAYLEEDFRKRVAAIQASREDMQKWINKKYANRPSKIL